MPVKPPKKRKSQQVHKKPDDLEQVRQNIFNAKTDAEKRMHQNILNKLEGKKCEPQSE